MKDLFRVEGSIGNQTVEGIQHQSFPYRICESDEIIQEFPNLEATIKEREAHYETVFFCFDFKKEVSLRGVRINQISSEYPVAQWWFVKFQFNQETIANMTVEDYNHFLKDSEEHVFVSSLQKLQWYDPNEYNFSNIKVREKVQDEGNINFQHLDLNGELLISQLNNTHIQGQRVHYQYEFQEVQSAQSFINPLSSVNTDFYRLDRTSQYEFGASHFSSPLFTIRVSMSPDTV